MKCFTINLEGKKKKALFYKQKKIVVYNLEKFNFPYVTLLRIYYSNRS